MKSASIHTSTDFPTPTSKWIVCQIGAREHYAVARGLADRSALEMLVTDAWAPFNGPLAHVVPRLAGRSHSRLDRNRVVSFTGSAVFRGLIERLRRSSNQTAVNLRRNAWFQKRAAAWLASFARREPGHRVVFSYSYAALKIFREARRHGWHTILGQIDPGPVEEDIVAEAVKNHADLRPCWSRAPEQYWEEWKQECELADHIIVNSQWSRDALDQAGINSDKVSVVPLMYDCKNLADHARKYPPIFTDDRPLNVLFLGSLIIRKGIAELLTTAQMMQNEPVEFWFVGQKGVSLTRDMKRNKKIHWVGPVSRSKTDKYYQKGDVFILPTLSDGFGLTQLEAMAHGLPVIASGNCGDVVQDGINGIRLDHVTPDHICRALMQCLEIPGKLPLWSKNALDRVKDFSPSKIFPLLMNSISNN